MHKQTVEVVRYPIVLNNQEYIVTEADPSGFSPGSMGAANIVESKILINDTMTEQQKMATLVHEVTHVIANQNALSCSESEQEVAVLANGIYDFIVNNPEVIINMITLYHDLEDLGLCNVEDEWDDEEEGKEMGYTANIKSSCCGCKS